MSIRLQVQAKRPGVDMMLNTVDMVFDYKGTYVSEAPEAYETLLLDVMLGDQTLFMRGDQVEEAWDLVMPILNSWQNRTSQDFPNYSADSWGPEASRSPRGQATASTGSRSRSTARNSPMQRHIFSSEETPCWGPWPTFFVATAEPGRCRPRALCGGLVGRQLAQKALRAAGLQRLPRPSGLGARRIYFFGDERTVPQTSPDSNYLMAKKALFDPLATRPGPYFCRRYDPGPGRGGGAVRRGHRGVFRRRAGPVRLGAARPGRQRPHGLAFSAHARAARPGGGREGRIRGRVEHHAYHPHGPAAQPGAGHGFPRVRRGQSHCRAANSEGSPRRGPVPRPTHCPRRRQCCIGSWTRPRLPI
ncbi:MAG: 6-phosphogluconolactonase [Hymenobacter sp.]